MMKPMQQWTTKEVANWLYCTGFADQTEHFKSITGLDLLGMSDSLPDELLRTLGSDLLEKLLQQIDFAKSIQQHCDDAGGLGDDTATPEELAATLARVTVEKQEIEKELALKDETIKQIQQKMDETFDHLDSEGVQHSAYPEERLLGVVHRHETESLQMKERHTQEIRAEELVIRQNRRQMEERSKESSSLASSLPSREAPPLGRRHFRQEPVSSHRFN
jgi:hypothetical protein